MTYRLGPDTAHAVAELVHAERPDWPIGVVLSVLESHAPAYTGSDLAVAAIRCAQDPASPGPKSIGWPGPHWRGLKTQPAPPVPVRCAVCGHLEHVCAYARPGIDDDHAFEPARRAS